KGNAEDVIKHLLATSREIATAFIAANRQLVCTCLRLCMIRAAFIDGVLPILRHAARVQARAGRQDQSESYLGLGKLRRAGEALWLGSRPYWFCPIAFPLWRRDATGVHPRNFPVPIVI